MQNEIYEKMTEMGKSSFTAMQELGAINSKVLKELSELQIGLATYSIETGVELTKNLSATTNYRDLISSKAEVANEYGNKVMEFNRKTADILSQSHNEVVNWFEKSIESATTETKPAAKRNSKKGAS